jgi:hypothetical protein
MSRNPTRRQISVTAHAAASTLFTRDNFNKLAVTGGSQGGALDASHFGG